MKLKVNAYSGKSPPPPQWIRIFMILRRMSSFFFYLFVCFKDFLEEFGIFRNDAIATCLLLQLLQLNKMDIMFMLIILTDFENIIIMISNQKLRPQSCKHLFITISLMAMINIQLKYSRWLNGHRKLSDSPCQIKETVMFSASIQNHRGQTIFSFSALI